MVTGTGLELGARVFFTQLRIPDDASNGSNGQAMPGFAVHAKDTDGVGHGEQFHIQRQGVDGKALLQKCAGLKNVTHAVMPVVDVYSSGTQVPETRSDRDKQALAARMRTRLRRDAVTDQCQRMLPAPNVGGSWWLHRT